MARKIVFYNHKGGVGKTTSAVNISTYLAINNKKVLVIDADPQGNCSENFGFDIFNAKNTIVEVLVNKVKTEQNIKKFNLTDNLFLLPSDIRMMNICADLEKDLDRYNILNKKIKEIEQFYDYIIIDSPPQHSIFSLNALFSADYIIIPFKPGQYEIAGLQEMFKLFSEIKDKTDNKLNILGIIITMYTKTRAMKIKIKEVYDNYEKIVFPSVVPINTSVVESTIQGVPLYIYDKKCSSAVAYQDISNEIVERLGGK